MSGENWLYSRRYGWVDDRGEVFVSPDPEFRHGLIEGFPEAKWNHPYPARAPRPGVPLDPAPEVLPDVEAVPGGQPLQRFQEDYVPTAGWPLVYPPQPVGNP
jgi:hypothetical protein